MHYGGNDTDPCCFINALVVDSFVIRLVFEGKG